MNKHILSSYYVVQVPSTLLGVVKHDKELWYTVSIPQATFNVAGKTKYI